MRRRLSRSWPLATMVCVVMALLVFSTKETDATLMPPGKRGDDGFSKHQSLKLRHHRFTGSMKVTCGNPLATFPSVTVTGAIIDGRVKGTFTIDTRDWYPISTFDVILNDVDRTRSGFQTEDFQAPRVDLLFARVEWLRGEVDLKQVRLTNGFRFSDTLTAETGGRKSLFCEASNSFNLVPL